MALLNKIEELLIDEKNINWFILHNLSENPQISPLISFGHSDNRNEKKQGYFNLSNEEVNIHWDDFEEFIKKFLNKYKNNVHLENLFVLISRLNNQNEEFKFMEIFKNHLDENTKKIIFHDLIDSLNDNLIVLLGKKSSFLSRNFDDLIFDDWINHIHNPVTPWTDTLNHTLNLISENKLIKYEYVKPMSNLMRIILISYGGEEILFSENEIEQILESKEDSIFLAAIIFHYYNTKNSNNLDLSDCIFDKFIRKYCEDIGIPLFERVFFFTQNPTNEILFNKLKIFISNSIKNCLEVENENAAKFVRSFSAERTFKAFANLVHECNINILNLNNKNLELLFEIFIDELKNSVNDISSKNNYPASPYMISRYNLKTQHRLLKIMLVLSKFYDKKSKEMEEILYDLKLLLYTKSRIVSLEFCSFLVAMSLSCDKNSDINLFYQPKIEKLVKKIDETILMPYVLSCEEIYDFWDVNEIFDTSDIISSSKNFLINYLLINLNPNIKCYNEIKEKIASIKNTKWLFDYEYMKDSEELIPMDIFLEDFYNNQF